MQDSLKEKTPGERMELIKKLAKDHPVPRTAPRRFLQVVDVGDFTPFELAAIYKIWQSMSPAARQQVERMKPVAGLCAIAFLRGERARPSTSPPY